MRALLFLLLLLPVDPVKVSRINRLKSEANQAYASANYQEAVQKYQYLVDSLGVLEEGVLLNLAHSYYHLGRFDLARIAYLVASAIGDNKIRSIAHQQMGVMANRQGKFDEALKHFKEALKANPANDEARYNYELLSKKMKDRKQQEPKPDETDRQKEEREKGQSQEKKHEPGDLTNQKEQAKDQSRQDQGARQEQSGKEQDDQQKNEKYDQGQNQQGMPVRPSKIDPQKAREILENMRHQEIQYLQQKKRKATRPRDSSKPDW